MFSVLTPIGSSAIRSHRSFGMSFCALPTLLILLLSLSFAAGQVRAQCGLLSGPSTTWNDGNGSWDVAGNWTSGTPDASTNACITDGTSTVTLDTAGSANGLQVASGNSLNSYGSLSLSSTSFTDGSINVQGTLANNSGAHLTNNGEFSLVGPEGTPMIIRNSGTFINNGGIYICCFGGGVIFNDAGFFANSGTLTGYSEALLNSATFNNSGLISLDGHPDSINFINSGTFNNSGTMDVNLQWEGSTFSNSGTFNNSGTINLYDNCFIGFGGSSCYAPNSGTFNNSGTINLYENCSPSVTNGYCSSTSNSGTFNNSGTLDITRGPAGGGDFTNSGIINNGGTLNNNVAATINNTGTLNNTSGANLNNFGTLTNSGIFNNTSGANLLNAGTINNSGIFTNSGAVMISSTGLFTTSTNYTQTAGSTLVDGTLTASGTAIVNIQGGTLGGTGTINGNVLMAGTMTPGAGGTPGSIVIFGNYEQTETGILEELMGPLSHSFLDVSGNTTLDSGSLLDITLLNGFDPLNQTFSIMDFASLNGQFANGSSFWDDGYLWDITYRQHEVDVTAVQAPEPSSLLLLFIGLAALALYAQRIRANTQRLA